MVYDLLPKRLRNRIGRVGSDGNCFWVELFAKVVVNFFKYVKISLSYSRVAAHSFDKTLIKYIPFFLLRDRIGAVANISHSHDPVFKHFVFCIFNGLQDHIFGQFSFLHYVLNKLQKPRPFFNLTFQVAQLKVAMAINKTWCNNAFKPLHIIACLRRGNQIFHGPVFFQHQNLIVPKAEAIK